MRHFNVPRRRSWSKYPLGKNMVSDATLLEDVWETIEGLLDDITTGSISWSGSWPSSKITSKSSYPIGIIDNASIISLSDLTLDYSTAQTNIGIPITIYDTDPKQVNQIVSDVIDKIRTSQDTLETAGLFFGNPLIANISTGMTMVEGIKVHWSQLDFRFSYIYT